MPRRSEDGVADTTGYSDTGGLVTRFQTGSPTSNVPEPASIVLCATGLARLIIRRRRILDRRRA